MRAALLALVGAICAAATALTGGQPVEADNGSISAIGNEAPIAIAVSPLYTQTHMVAAVTVPVGGCNDSCVHLWVTRDGGASWHRAPTTPGGDLVIVGARGGGERLVTSTNNAVLASADDGTSWTTLGPPGTPAAAGILGDDGLVVAGLGYADYAVAGGGRRAVAGSNGADSDLAFSVAPHTGLQPAALLAARDPHSGLPVVLRCDAHLVCSGGATLPGVTASSGNGISVLLAGASGTAYVRTSTAVYRSTDGGRTFLQIGLPLHVGAVYTTVSGATPAANGSADLYVTLLQVEGTGASTTTVGGVFATRDGGLSWNAVGSPSMLDGGATSVVAAPDGRLFAGYVNGHGQAGLLCSDPGLSWRATCGQPAACGAATQCMSRGASGRRITVTMAPGFATSAVVHTSSTGTAAAVGRPTAGGASASNEEGEPALAMPVLLAGGLLFVALAAVRRWRRSPR